ncbi:amidohydrolase [Pseudokineococcus basanitobsidens]|uniref:Amidohydrolase n=1 Tax=Pseudokineococcus basanitobsidens TaxID=1926649 RepID=A0ABU8RHF2_9ACTN
MTSTDPSAPPTAAVTRGEGADHADHTGQADHAGQADHTDHEAHEDAVRDLVDELAPALVPGLVALRRDLHAHPELGHHEHRTTQLLAERLEAAGLAPQLLPGTGLVCDVGDPAAAPVVLRADIDALPVTETSGVPFASTTPGTTHACGHDVHTVVVLGAALVLVEAHRRGLLGGRVRLLFQPAEEVTPGGAVEVLATGVLEGAQRFYAVHCDPRLDVGRVGLRHGAITSASDHVRVRLRGSGGHTSRPHLTGDLVFALGQVVTSLPAVLSRRLDPRTGVNLTWGRVEAGNAPNAIPVQGCVEGTLRVLDVAAWKEAGDILREVVASVAAPYAVEAVVEITPSVPPVDNDEDSVRAFQHAARLVLPEGAEARTEQSLGGEDFGWYLQDGAPGALARLGTRSPGGRTFDLHQGDFVADEGAVEVGVRLVAAVALLG